MLKILPHNLLIFLLSIIILIVSIGFYIEHNHFSVYEKGVNVETNAGPILFNSVKQDIDKKNITFNEIGIKFATYARKNNAHYKFVLYNDEKIIYEEQFKSNKLKDCEYHYFYTGNIKINENDKYSFKIIPIYVDAHNVITVLMDKEEINYTLSFKLNFLNWKLFLIFILIIIYFVINYFINTRKIGSNKFYLITLIYIFISLFLIPPYEVPDEPVHFFKSYKLSQVTLNKSFYDKISAEKQKAPSNMIDCLPYTFIQKIDKVNDYNKIKECLKNSPKKLIKLPGEAKSLDKTNPIAHIIPSIGIRIADIFSDSSIIIFFAGRLINAIICFIIIYYAIKVFPLNKNIILIVATIPMLLQQMTSYSYDALLNSCAILFVSYFVYLYKKNDKIHLKDWILLITTMSVITVIKYVYSPIFILLFFLNNNKFKKNKYLKIILCILLSSLLYLVWADILVKEFATNSVIISNVVAESKSNLDYLKSYPLDIIKIGYNTIRTQTVFYIQGLFGYFSWFRFSLHYTVVMSYIILLGILCSANKTIFNKKKKIILLISIIISIVGIMLALYLVWSTYKLNYVDGVQGRYFIPLIIPLLLCFFHKKEKIKLTDRTIYSFINLILLYYLIETISFYY